MIDLHTHSTFSDGSHTPQQLAEMAAAVNLKAVSLTDHDCVNGVDAFVEACDRHGVLGIPGVEISAEVEKGTMHILGYYVDSRDEALEAVLRKIRGGREARNVEILGKLNGLGCELTWDEVRAYAGEEVVGRPHFAMAMLARGYVKSKNKAFDRYLAKGKPAYAERFRLSPADSIEAIRAAGGLAVLAHPFTLDLKPAALRKRVAELRDVGLAGIEAYYSEHTPDMTGRYLELCRAFDLVAAGGSDFHGEVNPAVHLGVGFGSLNVPDAVVEALEERRNSSDSTRK